MTTRIDDADLPGAAPDTPSGASLAGQALPLDVLLSQIFTDIEDAVVVADDNRTIVLVNPAAAGLFGYKTEELIGRSTSILYEADAEFRSQGQRRFNKEAASSNESYVTRYKRKDGVGFDGETTGGPIRDPASGRLLFLGILHDVTIRRATERVLNRLHRITSDRSLDFVARRRAILVLGCEHFRLPIGIVSHIEGESYEVQEVIHPDHALSPGATFELGETYCVHTLAADSAVGFHHAGDSEIKDHPCYRGFGLEAYLGSPIVVDGQPYGTLNFSSPAPTRPFTQQDYELVALFAEWLGHELARKADLDALERVREELRHAATTDSLTGLANRRLLQGRLDEECRRAQRYGGEFGVALLDFDYFKRLNDSLGHAAGDAALCLFAELARRELRTVDLVGRWGGEEFLVIMPSTPAAGSILTTERLCAAVRSADFSFDGERVALSVSAGVAAFQSGESAEALISRVDAALYDAKAAGRDRVSRG